MAGYYTERVIRRVIDSTFTFSDVSPRFKNIDETYGNIFCPFHENKHSPAARMYWDDQREIWILHCFGECHTNFTTYDYINLILCKRYEKYKSPLDYLRHNLPPEELKRKLSNASKESFNDFNNYNNYLKTYINNVSYDSNSISEYIEKLYTA